VIEIERMPRLREPVLVGALSGWVDAGYAGAGSVALLVEQLTARAEVAHVDLSDLVDLAATRPMTHLVDRATREITWPRIDLVAGHLGVDVAVVHGPEPSLRWSEVSAAIVDLAARLGVRRAYFLGGMPTATSHRRPVDVAATATRREVAQELEPVRADYSGPTGFQTVLQVGLGDAGIDAVGLWAQVPGYLAATPSPPAIAATLRRLAELAGVDVRLRVLDDQVDAYLERVEAGLEQRPDVAEAIETIEAGDAARMPTGEELASEIERFLRDQ
jgi:proteasome assembly chaperone (PAC2) family protein